MLNFQQLKAAKILSGNFYGENYLENIVEMGFQENCTYI